MLPIQPRCGAVRDGAVSEMPEWRRKDNLTTPRTQLANTKSPRRREWAANSGRHPNNTTLTKSFSVPTDAQRLDQGGTEIARTRKEKSEARESVLGWLSPSERWRCLRCSIVLVSVLAVWLVSQSLPLTILITLVTTAISEDPESDKGLVTLFWTLFWLAVDRGPRTLDPDLDTMDRTSREHSYTKPTSSSSAKSRTGSTIDNTHRHHHRPSQTLPPIVTSAEPLITGDIVSSSDPPEVFATARPAGLHDLSSEESATSPSEPRFNPQYGLLEPSVHGSPLATPVMVLTPQDSASVSRSSSTGIRNPLDIAPVTMSTPVPPTDTTAPPAGWVHVNQLARAFHGQRQFDPDEVPKFDGTDVSDWMEELERAFEDCDIGDAAAKVRWMKRTCTSQIIADAKYAIVPTDWTQTKAAMMDLYKDHDNDVLYPPAEQLLQHYRV